MPPHTPKGLPAGLKPAAQPLAFLSNQSIKSFMYNATYTHASVDVGHLEVLIESHLQVV